MRSLKQPLTTNFLKMRMRHVQQPLTETIVVFTRPIPRSVTSNLAPAPRREISGKLSEVFGKLSGISGKLSGLHEYNVPGIIDDFRGTLYYGLT